jgi:Holliday junction resolvase RusA-like endonuclease
MVELSFWVPWSALCSDNRKFVSGQFILTKEYRESKALIGQLSLAAARKAKWVRAEGPLSLEVAVREPDRRRRDLNWSKNAKDGITAGEGVWWDDSQVRVECWRFVEPCDKAKAGAEVVIRVLDRFPGDADIGAHGEPSVGRSGDVRSATAPRLQRQGRVRGGASAPVEPAGPAAGRQKRGRKPARAAGERGAGGAVEGREGEAKVKARDVRSQTKTTGPSGHHPMGGTT